MSITIVFTSDSVQFNAVNKRTWNIGTDKPNIGDVSKVVTLYASDDELTLIRLRIKNLPDTIGNYTVWKEPWAQFIWDNLLLH